MSENNPEKSETESKPSQNEDETDPNEITDIQNCTKTNAVLPNIKDDSQTKEIIIDIDNVNIPKKDGIKELSVYGLYGVENRPLRTTWVMYQSGAALPDGETPLSYEPSRNGFVRLVLIIVLIMILLTAGFVGLVMISSEMKQTFRRHGFIIVLPAMVLMIGLNYAIACSPCTRLFPCNIVCLFLATIGMSIICAYVTSRYKTNIVLYAVLATSVVIGICVLLAFSSFDFTSWMIYIVVIAAAFGAVSMIAFLAMMISGVYLKMVHLVILIVGTLINVVVLTMELQMVLGGGAVEIGEDDYALAAFLIYTSIVDIFLKMVQMLGIFDSD